MIDGSVVLSAEQMNAVDRETQIRYGVAAAVLMENAGRAIWKIIEGESEFNSLPLLIVAGSGHNGGDALVVGRHARNAGRAVTVVLVKESLKDLTATQLSSLESIGVTPLYWEKDRNHVVALLSGPQLVIDGISGTGLTGPLREPSASLVGAINAAALSVLSIDVPSGARLAMDDADPIVDARWTVVTGCPKRSLYTARVRPATGDIAVVDPGFPAELVAEISAQDRLHHLVESASTASLPLDAHKGTRGRVLVVGGSPGTGGAAILAAEAALWFGAGMVRIVSSAGTIAAALVREPALLGDELPQRHDDERWDELFSWCDALVLGPGWTTVTNEYLHAIITKAVQRDLGVVVDASALDSVLAATANIDREWIAGRLVVTPHPGELARMLDGFSASRIAGDPYAAIAALRQMIPATVVLKDAVTIVDNGELVAVIDGREPTLGTAGSGDVLAGMIGTGIARRFTTGTAATNAVVAHLQAGRRLARDGWYSAGTLARSVGLPA